MPPIHTPVQRRPVNTCSRCRRLKLKCDHGRPCRGCVRSGGVDECQYDGSNSPPASKRRRQVRVCSRCRRLKLRCDQDKPCSSCVTANGDCVYQESEQRSEIHQLQQRIKDLESQLAPPTPASLASPVEGNADLSTLVSLLPPPDECRRLLRSFQAFDIFFRLVHMPSFLRRAEKIMARESPSLTDISLFVAGMLCGATTADTTTHPHATEQHLRLLLDSCLAMCDVNYTVLHKVDYVHVHLIAVFSCMAGRGGGPQPGWLAAGRAYHAALLAGINEDQEGSLLERETRRRIWWQVVQARLFIADRLRIKVPPMVHNVPRPANITDVELDAGKDTFHPADTLTEWSYLDSKLEMVTMFERRDALMARTDIPILERLQGAHRMIDDYAEKLPMHQRGESATTLPSWAQLQARISDLAVAELYVHLYRPYFSSEVGPHALDQAVRAAHRLVHVAKVFTEQVLYGWLDLDTPVFALWTCGMRSFTAGLVLAYALIADPDNDDAPARMADFEAMVGILRSRRTLPGRTRSNDNALATLEQLREIINAKDRSVHQLLDPYTGKAVDLPLAIPDFYSGEWVEWDTLFQELFSIHDLVEDILRHQPLNDVPPVDHLGRVVRPWPPTTVSTNIVTYHSQSPSVSYRWLFHQTQKAIDALADEAVCIEEEIHTLADDPWCIKDTVRALKDILMLDAWSPLDPSR